MVIALNSRTVPTATRQHQKNGRRWLEPSGFEPGTPIETRIQAVRREIGFVTERRLMILLYIPDGRDLCSGCTRRAGVSGDRMDRVLSHITAAPGLIVRQFFRRPLINTQRITTLVDAD